MKKTPILLTAALSALVLHACTKKYNNGVDRTVNIAGVSRLWTGTAWGNIEDTTLTPDTVVVKTAKPYSRNVDTSFSVLKHDTYTIIVLGTKLRYRSTDSIEQTVIFDSTFAGTSDKTILKYYYNKDSMTYEYHNVKGLNQYSGKYIEQHWKLRTKHS